MASVQVKRGTRAQIEAAKTANGLLNGEPYLITDESRLAVGTGVNSYAAMATQPEVAIQNGFENRTDSTLSFVDGTRTFSITGTFSYWSNGIRYTSTGASVVITDTEGLHYVYFNGATLTTTTTFSETLLTDYTFVSAIYWDADNNSHLLLMDERHGREMDSVTHLYLHNTQGARYGSGLGLTGIVADGNGKSDTHAQLGYEAGTFWDEDIKHIISADTAPAQIPLFYRSGSTGVWRRIAATDYPMTTTGTGRMAYNEWTGATWQLTEVTNNDWALTHLFATGDAAQPIIGIIGQAKYTLATAADDGAVAELQALQFGIISTLTPEVLPIASVLFKTVTSYTNAVNARIESVNGADYIDWRKTSVFSAGVSSGLYEPSLGNPASDGQVLASTAAGVRSWVSGGGSPGLVLLATATASNVTSVDFTSGIDNTYDEYEIHLSNVKPADDGSQLWLRTSANSGSTYDAGSTDYFYNGFWNGPQYYSAVGVKSNATSGSSKIYLVGEGCGNATNEYGCSGVVRFHRPSATQYFSCHASISWFNQFGYLNIGEFSGNRVSAAAVNAIRFLFDAGNIASGEFKLYGLRKSL